MDEIQNIVNHKQGKSLVGMLTQLINNSGISICMVGTPQASDFFESVDYLARRALGLRYGKCEYNAYFREFCNLLFSYQYVQEESVLSDGMIQWLYEHSSGVLAVVVSLIHDAQEISILNGREILDMTSLNEAYDQRMNMLHSHIRPSAVMKKGAVKKKKADSADVAGNYQQEEKAGSRGLLKGGLKPEGAGAVSLLADEQETVSCAGRDMMHHISTDRQESNEGTVTFSADKGDIPDWTFMELAEQAKKERYDMVELLKGRISITEIAV